MGYVVQREIIEAFASKEGLQNYQLAHVYANKFFGDVLLEKIEALPAGAQMASVARATLNFRRIRNRVSIDITLTTPQPAESLPTRFDYLQGNLKVNKPDQK